MNNFQKPDMCERTSLQQPPPIFDSFYRKGIPRQDYELGDFTLSQLDSLILQRLVNKLKDNGLADTSVRRIFSIVYTSLDMAVKMQLIPQN